MPVIFRNPGVLDPVSIATFGINAKVSDSAIGFFGTGLKYAIAVLLRMGQRIRITSGGADYTFATQTQNVRGKSFDIVTMNGSPLGFTTELGKTWELWQAFRELYCNMLDEGGTAEHVPAGGVWTAGSDETVVAVMGAEFEEEWFKREEIVLSSAAKRTEQSEVIEIIDRRSPHAYYRGIRALKLEKPALLTYNLVKKCELTEDRTVKDSWVLPARAVFLIGSSENADLIRRVISAPEEAWESGLYFSALSYSDTFRDVALKLIFDGCPTLNPSVRDMMRRDHFSKTVEREPFTLDLTDQQRLQGAIAFCKRIGIPVTKYPIVATENLGPGVMGLADGDTIYVSKKAFQMGTKQLVGTLIEEYLHLSTGYADETRELQNTLVDLVVSVGERLTKKPL